jgi:DNA-binding NarL/FixJ family response regulator
MDSSLSIRVLLVDDHTILRQGLRHILGQETDISVVGEAGSGLQAVRLAERLNPDVVVMDIAMPELNGIDATSQIVRQCAGIGVLILSMFSDERYVLRSVRAGARGYLTKDTVEHDLIRAIHAVHASQSFFSPAISKIILDNYKRVLNKQFVDDRSECLSDREKQIYQLLAEGRSNKEIAATLYLSIHTVETHRSKIMEKLGVHSLAELVLSAVRRGIVG